MNLVLTRGCTANNLEYGDESVYDMNDLNKEAVLFKLLEFCKAQQGIEGVIETLVESYYTDYSFDDHPCEQCGDTVTTYEIEI